MQDYHHFWPSLFAPLDLTSLVSPEYNDASESIPNKNTRKKVSLA